MGYKIRYDTDSERDIFLHGEMIRWMMAAGLAACAWILGFIGEGKDSFMGMILSGKNGGVAETALAEMAETLAGGEGWYQALAVWCGSILEAGGV